MNRSRLVKLLIPTAGQAAVCLVLALVIQGLVFQGVILPRFIKPSPLTPYLNTGRQVELSQLNNFSFIRLAVQGAFWAIVGLCAYIVYLGIINAIVEARNEVVVSRRFANKGGRSGWVRIFKWQIGLLAVLLLIIWLTGQFGFNYWFNLMSELVFGGVGLWHLAAAAISALGLAANLYLIWVLSEPAIVADR